MQVKKSIVALALSAAFIGGCNNTTAPETKTPEQAQTAVQVESESVRLNALFEKVFMDAVMRSPEYQTYLGIKDDYDKWDDDSEANAEKELQITKDNLELLKTFNYDALDAQTKISYTLAKQSMEREIADYKWRYHNYPVNQMFGTHSSIPSFLINQHTVKNLEEAQAYISRLNGVDTVIEQLIVQLKIREDMGIIAPSFVFPHVIRDSQNLIAGAPFDNGDDSTLLADFKKKVNALEIEDGAKSELLVLPIQEHSKYLYIYVNNYTDQYGKYEIYVHQIDLGELVGEALALSGVEYLAEAFIRELFGVDEQSSSSDQNDANRAAVGLVSQLQGKSLSDTTEGLLINEVRRAFAGDNSFVSAFMANFGTSLVKNIYSRY